MKNADEILKISLAGIKPGNGSTEDWTKGISQPEENAKQLELVAPLPESHAPDMASASSKSRRAFRVTQFRALHWLKRLLEGTEARL